MGLAVIALLMAACAIAASMLGTTLAGSILERMSDAQFRRWAGRIVAGIASWYIAYGSYLLVLS